MRNAGAGGHLLDSGTEARFDNVADAEARPRLIGRRRHQGDAQRVESALSDPAESAPTLGWLSAPGTKITGPSRFWSSDTNES